MLTETVIERGWVPSRAGDRKFTGAVDLDEARTLHDLIIATNSKSVLEIGVANGISTLAMCEAVSTQGGNIVGIDPCQFSDHQGAALELLSEFSLIDRFELRDGPTHLVGPKLVEEGRRFDLVFIDGHHRFDYKFLDLFYANLLLKDGGHLVFHDILLQSTKKIYRFIRSHMNFDSVPLNYKAPTFSRKVRYTLGALLKQRTFWYWWPGGYRNLLVLRKNTQTEPAWDFYRDF